MEFFVRGFVRSSLIWLGIGVLLGVTMAVAPGAIVYRPAHAHANLLGFVSMMIFGVAYHVIPRFSARPLHSRAAAGLHLWVANAGLALLVSGWLLRPGGFSGATTLVHAGAALSAGGAFLFIYNIWNTVGDASPHGIMLAPGGRQDTVRSAPVDRS